MRPTLRFLGATQTVTGSRFLLSANGTSILVDCGLFQGPRDIRQRNWDPFPVDPASIDAVLVTHAHLDHTGYLPALVRDGLRADVHATPDTVGLASIVLPDSGHLQEEEAEYSNRARASRHHPALPLYTEEDAWRAVDVLRAVPFDRPTEIAGAKVVFRPAGHILGSATVTLEVGGRTIQLTGDLGRAVHPLLAPPLPPEVADTLVIESTYGNRTHEPLDSLRTRLASVIRTTAARGGTIVVPAFAVDRTEMILWELAQLVADGAVPSLPVYVDSPMALRALAVYRSAIEAGSDDVRPAMRGETDLFAPLDLREARTTDESKALNDIAYPSIIVSASGMASGGRVLHHLARLLPDARNSVLLVGFQAVGTRGRILQDGARSVKIFGEYVAVRARVEDLTGLSAHADSDELVRWVRSAPRPPKQIFVVHGEPAGASALRGRLEEVVDAVVVIPQHLEQVALA